jgi:hypothetical protein
MAIQTKNTLKTYFETGDFPTQTQFADLIDSLLHVAGSITISQVTNLQGILNGLSQQATLTGVADESQEFVLSEAQLVREVVFWGAAPLTLTLRLKGDTDTDQEVSVETGKRTVILVNTFFEAEESFEIIDPTDVVEYAIFRVGI